MPEPTYTFDATLSDNRSKLRVELGDQVLNQGKGVKPGGGNLSNEELEYWLTEASSASHVVLEAAARGCEALARMWAPAHDLEDGPIKEAFSQTADRWNKQAAQLRARINGALIRTALVWPP